MAYGSHLDKGFLAEATKGLRGLLSWDAMAVLAASAGREAEAEEKIRLAIKEGSGFGHFHHTAYHIACAYALMNKHDEAMKWLKSAAEDGFPCYPLFEKDNGLNNLRQDPQFQSFMADIKKGWENYKSRF